MSTRPQLAEAKEHIDQVFGVRYAVEHPELVGWYLMAHAVQEIDETLASTAQSLLNLSDKARPILKFLGIEK